MDAIGARLLAARIAAGVRIGSVIELIADSDADSELRVGDRGVVCGIEAGGAVVVEWDRGFHSAIDPRRSAFRALPAFS
jgi:Domain of unknown function (DUF4314)